MRNVPRINDWLELIERNEKLNEELTENFTSGILSFDKEDFWVKKTQTQ